MNLAPLPSTSSEPLYVRLKIALRDLIGSGLQAGDKLPSEAELCRKYAISRITVRQALGALENEGVIERRQGKGSFVSVPKLQEPISYFGSFTEEISAHGKRSSSKLVSLEVIEADLRVAQQLRLESGIKVLKVRRVRCADSQPICYQVTYVPHALLPHITRGALRRESLYTHLERSLGETLHEAEEIVEALLADPYRAELLQIKKGAPLLLIERRVFTRSGAAVEFNRSFYNAQMLRLTLRSRRATFGEHSRLVFRAHDEKVAVND